MGTSERLNAHTLPIEERLGFDVCMRLKGKHFDRRVKA
jgi:hypothetical protein